MANDPNLPVLAMTSGVKHAFLLAFGLIMIAWIISFKIKRAVHVETEPLNGQEQGAV